MIHKNLNNQGTILVYTLLLVVLAVFMATAVLNTSTQLYNSSEISEISFDTKRGIKSKGQYVLQYDQNLNTTGSGFTDNIGCPKDFSMSGSTTQGSSISSDIRYLTGSILCRANYVGNSIDFFFNSSFTDLESVTYLGETLSIDSLNTDDTFSDGDSTFIDIAASYPLPSDTYDDNFDDDDYSPYMNGGGDPYPDGYSDNDGDARRIAFGYVIPSQGNISKNIFWLNQDIRDEIFNNPYNVGSNFLPIGSVSSGRIYIESDQDYQINIYSFDRNSYISNQEINLQNIDESTTIFSGSGYIQNDMTVSPVVTGNEYIFDFSTQDYAFFLENESSDLLAYSFRMEDTISGNEAYISPINYGGGGSYYTSNNMILDESGNLIGGSDIVALGSYSLSSFVGATTSPPSVGLAGWYDMTNPLYYTESGGRVSQVNDRSGNSRHLTQANTSLQPALQGDGMTGSGYVGSYFDISNPANIARVYVKMSYDYPSFQDYDFLLAGTSGSFGAPRIMGNTGNTNLLRSQNPTDVVASVDGAAFSNDIPLPINNSVLIFEYTNPQDFTTVMGSAYSASRSFKGEIEKLLLYDTIPSTEDEAKIIEYLNYELPVPPGPPTPNIVQFDYEDEVENIALGGFDTSGYSLKVDDFSTDLDENFFFFHSGSNRYIQVQASGRIKLVVRRSDNTVAVNTTTSPANALLASTYYDLEFIITNSEYSILIDDNVVSSGAITGATNFLLPDDLNNSTHTSTFTTSGITFRDGLGNIIFEESGDAASWNTKLTSGSVEDI